MRERESGPASPAGAARDRYGKAPIVGGKFEGVNSEDGR